jgi:hypothetical protein
MNELNAKTQRRRDAALYFFLRKKYTREKLCVSLSLRSTHYKVGCRIVTENFTKNLSSDLANIYAAMVTIQQV